MLKKVCNHCGKSYGRRMNDKAKRRESITSFKTSKFCSVKCYNDSRDNKLENGNFICKTCGKEKTKEEFSVDAKQRHRISHSCKECNNTKVNLRWEALSPEAKAVKTIAAKRGLRRGDIPEEIAKAHVLEKLVKSKINDLVVSNHCEGCGKEMFRGDGDTGKFLAKKYCSHKCSTDFRYKANEKKLLLVKICPTCKKEFRPIENQPISWFTKRKYCCRECFELSRTVKCVSTKICIVCNKEFGRRRNKNGYLISSHKWKKQTHCSVKCVEVGRRGKRKKKKTYEANLIADYNRKFSSIN